MDEFPVPIDGFSEKAANQCEFFNGHPTAIAHPIGKTAYISCIARETLTISSFVCDGPSSLI
jgi:hypothetical protein